jgi:UDP-4-amino-4,6-dideoxy-N-acetyl-beta-L-altrosamine N-acetyltransferase
MHIDLKNFTYLSETEKNNILLWRNHPNIKRWMYTSYNITKEEHFNFIKTLEKDESKQYFMVQYNTEAIGVIYFTDIDYNKKVAEFGIYANPDKKGYGKYLMTSITDYAFDVMKLNRIYAEVFANNNKAIKLYRKFSFIQVGKKRYKEQEILIMELKNENR